MFRALLRTITKREVVKQASKDHINIDFEIKTLRFHHHYKSHWFDGKFDAKCKILTQSTNIIDWC